MIITILTVHNQQESSVQKRILSTLFNSIRVGKILPSTVSHFNFHGRNGHMVSSDHCYCDWACLPVTQSSNGHHDVGRLLLLGVQIIVPKSRRPSLPDRSCLSVTQCSNRYESSTHCYYEFEVPCPITKASLRICHRWWL
jgi:hypothetical protein